MSLHLNLLVNTYTSRYVLVNMLLLFMASCGNDRSETHSPDWNVYRGDDGVNAYSASSQINTGNVQQLKLAWTFRTGDTIGRSSIQCNPLIIGGTMYGISPQMKLFALDAATGKQKWIFDPFSKQGKESGVSRGMAYWTAGNDRRIFFCASHKLYAIDANSGLQLMSFGDSGFADMRAGLRDDSEIENYFIRNTSPPVVFKNLVIIGSSMGETYLGLPGNIRAYDVHTGKLVWMFNTIPKPGEFGYDTWPEDAYKYAGGCNAWSGLSIDRARGLLFAATGAPSFDFHGGDRRGDNLFGNCVLALNAETGKYVWHFQVTHHDLWDYDLPSPPNLTTIDVAGMKKDVVVQVTKQGFVFILDRVSGKPVFPVSEKNVPQSWMPDEFTSTTQPFPALPAPLVPQKFDTGEITNISQAARDYVNTLVDSFDFGEIYTPPNTKGIIQLPGFRGGAEWSGAAIDNKGRMYVGVNNIANIVQLVELERESAIPSNLTLRQAGNLIFQKNCSSCHGADRKGNGPYPSLRQLEKRLDAGQVKHIIANGRGNMPAFAQLDVEQKEALVAFLFNSAPDKKYTGDTASNVTEPPASKKYKIRGYLQLRDHEGYPGTKPPWGMLKALDLNSGNLLWSRPLGDYPALLSQGKEGLGTQLFGGAVATAGDLIFIGASQDEKFRAINAANGETLWEYQLPAGGYATPSVYEVDGRQYVVIAAGGGGFQATKPGDYYMAFSL
jgi:quinoprotein glucose dehydrogenase